MLCFIVVVIIVFFYRMFYNWNWNNCNRSTIGFISLVHSLRAILYLYYGYINSRQLRNFRYGLSIYAFGANVFKNRAMWNKYELVYICVSHVTPTKVNIKSYDTYIKGFISLHVMLKHYIMFKEQLHQLNKINAKLSI